MSEVLHFETIDLIVGTHVLSDPKMLPFPTENSLSISQRVTVFRKEILTVRRLLVLEMIPRKLVGEI